MAPAPPFSGSSARDRLEKELQDESQRIRQACLQLTDIDPQTERSRYEALVQAMLDTLDRQATHDSVALGSPLAGRHPDLLDIDPRALNALIARLRNQGTNDGPSSEPFQVLGHRVGDSLARDLEDRRTDVSSTSINWEDLADRMDVMRQRLYQETQADRLCTSSEGAAAPRRMSAPSSDSP